MTAVTPRPRRARTPTRFGSRAFPSDLQAALRDEIARAHRERPFRICDPRDAARRVDRLLHDHGVRTVFVRGALDIGGAELDHVWTVADGRVVDVTVPVADEDFLHLLRGYVAGDVEPEDIDRAANERPIELRVIGVYDETRVSYVGLPVWGSQPLRA